MSSIKLFVYLVIMTATTLICSDSFCQSVGELLDDSERIKSRHKLFLKFDGSKFYIDHGERPVNFLSLQDSSLYLPHDKGINIYIQPVNPLNYSFSSDVVFTADPISEAYQSAFDALVTQLQAKSTPSVAAGSRLPRTSLLNVSETCANGIIDKLKELIDSINVDKKDSLKEVFKRLKVLDFVDQNETLHEIKKIRDDFKKISDYYTDLSRKLIKKRDEVKTICNDTNTFSVQSALHYQIDKAQEVLKVHLTRVSNVEKALKLVEEASKEASKSKEGLEWITHVAEVRLQKGKITNFKIIIKNSGLKLSDEEEIVKVEAKDLKSTTIRFRSFQRFVPEVRSGIAYSFFEFKTFSTTTDAAGDQRVAEANEENFKQLTFDAMVNFVYYSTKSPILPFIQVGVGANASYPTLFSGIGIMTNAKGRLSISGGLAYTWVQTLDKLSVNEIVSGPAAVQQDVKYEFVWPPKPYIGIQLKF